MEETFVSVGLFDQFAIFMREGGPFMFVIAIAWAIGMAIALERFWKLSFTYNVDGASFMNEIQRYVLSNDIQGAIRVCSGTLAALPKVLKSGLQRYNQTPEQIQNAIDATSLEVIPRLELRLNYLQLIANIATLLGLLGTISGLRASFAAAAAVDPQQRAEMLTQGIAIAMNTTYLGLVVAVIIMVLHAFLASKAEKITSEIDEYSVKLMDLIGTKKVKEE